MTSLQRFTRSNPCPVCGGSEDDARGSGTRCYGYLSSDKNYAHCTRAEHAADLPMRLSSKTYGHRLAGDCRCGVRHDPRPAPNGHEKAARRIVAVYDYRDEAGALLFQAVRFEPKSFKQRRPDGTGGWTWNLAGCRRVLYQLPALLSAEPGATVFVVEGEKDADALAALGLVATTNAGGAGKWRQEYADALRERHVVILPDADEPGRRHAQQVAASLASVAASVKILDLPSLPGKGDLSDWLAGGGTRDELARLAAEAAEWQPAAAAVASRATDAERQPGPVLVALADVEPEEVDWLWPGRIPRGKLTVLDGDPGLGKSVLTLDIAARVSTGRAMPGDTRSDLARPAGVVLLSAEDGLADTIRPRLDAAGADVTRIVALTE